MDCTLVVGCEVVRERVVVDWWFVLRDDGVCVDDEVVSDVESSGDCTLVLGREVMKGTVDCVVVVVVVSVVDSAVDSGRVVLW